MSGRLLIAGSIIMCALVLGVVNPAWCQEEGQTAAEGIHIEDAAICQNIVDRKPIGTGDVFAKEISKVFCFCRVVGATTPTQITFNWYHQGSLKSTVKLPVESASWRTWSSKAMSSELTGEWMVEILAEDGAPLESIIFFIQ